MATSKYVKRITLFKIAKDEDVSAAVEKYKTLRESATKDGKPYILYNEAGKVVNSSEERAQGYTLCGQTWFSSHDDVKYYDTECEAHKNFKKFVTPIRTGVMVVHVETDSLPSSSKSS